MPLALLRFWNSAHDLRDMLTTTRPCDLAALTTANLRTHLHLQSNRSCVTIPPGVYYCPVVRGESVAKRTKVSVLRSEAQLEEILNRVKRAEGQMAGVIRMLEEGRSCEEIVHQMSAVGKAINTAAITLIASSLQECILDKKSNNPEQRERLQKLFLSLA